MIQVEIGEGIHFEHTDALKQAAEAAVKHSRVAEPVELTIALEGDERLQQLNRDFLGTDAVTDVLSFPADEFDPDAQSKYIGDVVISFPQAQHQAQNAGHPTLAELQLLVVHGVLHLLGYDHAEEAEKQAMWQQQAEILAEIGCEIKKLPE
jgi:probable rRNA maturation factor